MKEEVVQFGPQSDLVGILSLPGNTAEQDLPGVILVNAGILHRVGPHRQHVKIARKLATAGFRVLRFDFHGLGDSPAAKTSGSSFVEDAKAAIALLVDRTAVRHVVFIGICTGALVALNASGLDDRIQGLVLIEDIYLKTNRYYIRRMLNPAKWWRVITGKSNFLKRLGKPQKQAAPARSKQGENETSMLMTGGAYSGGSHKDKIEAFQGRGGKMLLVYREGNEIRYNYRLKRKGDVWVAKNPGPGTTVIFVPFADHTFTSLLAQKYLAEYIQAWIRN